EIGVDLRIAVNVSPRNLVHDDLPATIVSAAAESGVPASVLEVEITETAVMTDPERVILVLDRLNALGVPVSIDDFGSGFTSLAHLASLPVRSLKIDRRFIADILDNHADEVIVRNVIRLAGELGMSVLAEGVETPDVWRRL